MNRHLLVSIVALSVATFIFYRLARDAHEPSVGSEIVRFEAAAEKDPESLSLSSDIPEAVSPDEYQGDSDGCLTLKQLETHPSFARDAARFDAVGTNGPTIDSYRGLSRGELHGLAAQRDSAAMTVLGAMALMRASGLPENEAVAYLMNERNDLFAATQKRPEDDAARAHLEEARGLFYQSALHGRVMALYYVGNLLWIEKGGAVDLGWIDEDTFGALSPYEKNTLLPPNLYNALAYEIAPELATGVIGTMFFELSLPSDHQQPIVKMLSDQFHRDLDAAGLPPISVPESTVPSRESLLALVCESELDHLEIPRGE